MNTTTKQALLPLNEKEIKALCTETPETLLNSLQLKKFTAIDMWNIQRGRKATFKRTTGTFF